MWTGAPLTPEYIATQVDDPARYLQLTLFSYQLESNALEREAALSDLIPLVLRAYDGDRAVLGAALRGGDLARMPELVASLAEDPDRRAQMALAQAFRVMGCVDEAVEMIERMAAPIALTAIYVLASGDAGRLARIEPQSEFGAIRLGAIAAVAAADDPVDALVAFQSELRTFAQSLGVPPDQLLDWAGVETAVRVAMLGDRELDHSLFHTPADPAQYNALTLWLAVAGYCDDAFSMADQLLPRSGGSPELRRQLDPELHAAVFWCAGR